MSWLWPGPSYFCNDESQCVFTNTIKVCNSFSWQCLGTSAPIAAHLTVSMYLLAPEATHYRQVKGPSRTPCQLKKPCKCPWQSWGSCFPSRQMICFTNLASLIFYCLKPLCMILPSYVLYFYNIVVHIPAFYSKSSCFTQRQCCSSRKLCSLCDSSWLLLASSHSTQAGVEAAAAHSGLSNFSHIALGVTEGFKKYVNEKFYFCWNGTCTQASS